MTRDLVDDLYEEFVEQVGPPLSESARDLPRVLRLAHSALPWSRVFSHEVTLGAPALLAEAMVGVPAAFVRDAVLAHMLAVIESFGTARIEDERIDASPQVFAVLGRARLERDRAMARLFSRTPLADTDFRAADAMTIRAVRRERSMVESSYPVDFDLYEKTLVDKRCSGVLASVALARIAGLGTRHARAVRATLESIALSLEIYGDVVDWERDLARGGSWVTCLMRGALAPPYSGKHATRGASRRNEILGSGVLEVMLGRSRMHMRAARRRASALRAAGLALWAGTQEGVLAGLDATDASDEALGVREQAMRGTGTT
ncbi:MAG TPA: hypothetical protein VHV30_10570 [Polyangiaceae bacterium]|nr:hypothetical protein [Polyangiaceae bacterium]